MKSSPKTKVPGVFSGKAWQQVLRRDSSADGQFVYAVQSTGIFCRPSCSSRTPDRKNIRFYPGPQQAVAAGFRACLRCRPELAAPRPDPQQAAVEAVSSYLVERGGERTRLRDVSKATGVSPLNIVRGFKRVLGVSPREFARANRKERSREKNRPGRAESVSGAGTVQAPQPPQALQPSKQPQPARDLGPGAAQKSKPGGEIRYAVAASPLGLMLVAATARGLCAVLFADSEQELVQELRTRFADAEIRAAASELDGEVAAVLDAMGQAPARTLAVDVRATPFQQRVWQELQAIPRGETRTYTQLAEALGSPRSVRAVAGACARNPLAVLVPCHRVMGKDGSLTGYRWGVERKRALLAMERERAAPAVEREVESR